MTKYKGRPRDENTRVKILETMLELVNSTQSFQRITMDNIAQTAGVSKATLYKWWKCKELLFIEAFMHYTHYHLPKLQISKEIEGRFLDTFLERMLKIRRFLLEPIGKTMMEVAMLSSEYERLFRQAYQLPRRKGLKEVFIHYGVQTYAEEDVDLFLDQCFAMLYYSAVIHKEETDEEMIRKITRLYQLILSNDKP